MDGNVVAKKIQSSIATQLAKHPNANITLATVLIGEDQASQLYVGMKQRRAAAIGIQSKHIHFFQLRIDQILPVCAGGRDLRGDCCSDVFSISFSVFQEEENLY